MLRPAQTSPAARIAAFDGLRGVAAAIVVVFHYLYLLHWQVLPGRAPLTPWISDTPLAILWNGPFAVSVFFVLSGFVMAAAADRRRGELLANAATRYLRLAVPVTASVLLAWALLSLMPDQAARMAAVQEDPSPWLQFTYQDPIPGLHIALFEGGLGTFLRGWSQFNNVLWTMKIELIGSLMLFAVYWATSGRRRLWVLAAAGLAIPVVMAHAFYLAFVAGALLYEAHKAGALSRLPPWTGALSLAAGIVIGAPGPGIDDRLGLVPAPSLFRLGNDEGVFPVLAAACLLYAAMTVRPVISLLTSTVPLWLGRISFGLYLVHVPLLYTVVALAHTSADLPGPVIALGFGVLVLALAHVFTLAVDEPTLRGLRRVRAALGQRRRGDTPEPLDTRL